MRFTQHEHIESIIERETVVLRDDLGLTIDIQSLPPDFDDQLQSELPDPIAKRLGVEKDGKGKVILDENNRPIVRYDTENEDYREKKRVNAKLQSIASIVAGIAPDQIEFDANKDELGARAFYVAVLGEMKAIGFGMGDIITLITRIGGLSGLSEKDIQEAELGFSTAEAGLDSGM